MSTITMRKQTPKPKLPNLSKFIEEVEEWKQTTGNEIRIEYETEALEYIPSNEGAELKPVAVEGGVSSKLVRLRDRVLGWIRNRV